MVERLLSVALLLVMTLMTFAIASLGTRVTAPHCPFDSSSRSLGLCIDDAAAAVRDDRRVTVHVLIRNGVVGSIRGRVWWILAPLGPGAPWDRSIFQSTVDDREYASTTLAALIWDTTPAVPSAFYDLVVLVHIVSALGVETHVESRDLGPVHIGSPAAQPWLIRLHEGTGPATILSASAPEVFDSGSSPSMRVLTIANDSNGAVDVSVRLEARVSFVGWEDRRTQAQLIYSIELVRSTLKATQSDTFRVPAIPAEPLMTSFPDAQLWLVVTVGGHTEDEVLLGGPDWFRPPKPLLYTRRGVPSGPIEVVDVRAIGQWTRSRAQIAAVSISNLTGAPQSVRAWWFVAPVDDVKPWTDALASGTPVSVTLGPWATKTLSIRAPRSASGGRWQLSAWAHYETRPGAFIQSDAIWRDELITVGWA
jgi:hypothetical protein